MVRYLTLFFMLMIFWIMLSGRIDLAGGDAYLFTCGIVGCVVATLLARRVGFLYEEGPFFTILARHYAYAPWLTWQIVLSSWDVTKCVWGKASRLNPEMLRVPYRMKTELATVIYANSITLTPGTTTVDIDTEKREMLIYSLHEGSRAGLEDMHDRVLALEGNQGGEP
ncbi:MAG: Na+/H+ antiporter subunit E [Planctomycetes bacterium]|nr:Na+/H+ antiporter subunit E [Planctomycetota bacterium]